MLTIKDIKIGDTLIHPFHGKMKVIDIEKNKYEEFIEEEKDFKAGFRIKARFNKFIPGVKWVHKTPKGIKKSELIFHSWYLRKLEKA